MRGPQALAVGGAIIWSSGEFAQNVAITQGAGSSLTIAQSKVEPQAYLDYGSSIVTASPVTIDTNNFDTDHTSLTTTSTITLAPGLSLSTEGDDGTFTAAGIGSNTGPTYGFGADTLNLTGGTTTVAPGTTLDSGPLTLQGGVLQDDGTIGESQFSISSPSSTSTTLTGGTLDGTGSVDGALTNSSGTVDPGAPGSLTVGGSYTQEAGGTLGIGIAGTTPGTGFDQMVVGGSATLGGTLSLVDEAGFKPALGDTFKIISGASSREGTFASVDGPSASQYGVEYNPDGATLTTSAAGLEEPSPPIKEEPAKTTTTTGPSTSPVVGTSTTTTASTSVATSPKAVEELLNGCSSSALVLNDAYIQGSHVFLSGSAAKSLVGKKVKILFNEGKPVATATVKANGQYTTTAPLPPAKIRDSLTTRYTAEVGKVRSVHLKLVRRLLLEPPRASGTTITLTGQLTLPLTKPIAPVVVEQQLECGKTTIAKTFTPAANGRFHITLTVPANAKAGIFRLTSKVAANKHSVTHGFTTFSLPLPVAIG